MKSKHNIIAIGVLGVALAIAIVVLSGVSWNWHAATAPMTATQPSQNISSTGTGSSPASSTASVPEKLLQPPHGSVTYQIAQAATQLPGFLQATIDPVDVQVGQVQHFIIVTSDPNPITSVVAQITTDHKVITVPLVSQGAPAVSMLIPHTVAVDASGHLALIAPGTAATVADAAGANTAQGAHVANAATANDTKFTGQWTVEDTHTAKYETTFIAKDSAGNTNSVTVAWLDPCTAFTSSNNYSGGTATVSGPCSLDSGQAGISSVDGPENGNLLVSGSGVSLTINSNATLVINSGYSISFSGGGAIVIPSATAQILLGQNMCGTDADGDGYMAGYSWTAASSCSGTSVPRTNFTVGHINDCNDSNSNVFPGQTAWFTSPAVTNMNLSTGQYDGGGESNYDYSCSSAVTLQYPTAGTFTGANGCNSPSTCYSHSYTSGWASGVPACGGTGSVYVDQGNVAVCSNGTTHCDVIGTASAGYSQGCH